MRIVARLAVLTLLACVLMMGAGIDGKWKFTFETPVGVRETVWELQAKGGELVAKVTGSDAEAKGTFEKNRISLSTEFFSPDAGYKATLTMKGEVQGNKINGEWGWDTYTGPMTAERTE